METILSTTPAVYFAISLTFGLSALSLALGIHGLIVKNMFQILSAIHIISLFVIFIGFFTILPDWFVFGAGILLLITALLSISTQYIIEKRVGKLLLPISATLADKKWLLNATLGFFWIVIGLLNILPPWYPSFLHLFAIPSYYTFYILLICVGILQMLGFQNIKITQQIGDNGILDEHGIFYGWDTIENFAWDRAVGKLSFKLKSPINNKKTVEFQHIPFEVRPEIYPYLQQHINSSSSVSN